MTNKALRYKNQIGGVESFIDNMFVVFSQSYLINSIQKFCKEKGFDSKNRARVMELGCYNGRVQLFAVQRMVYCTYTGVDVRQDYIDFSAVANRKDSSMICEDATLGLSLANDSQDIIISSEVIEHLEASELPDVIKEMHRILADGGRMVLGFPMNTQNDEFHKVEKETSLSHVNFPAHEDFIALVESAGFTLNHFDSSFNLRSSYRFPKSVRNDPHYIKLRDTLGSSVARAVFLTLTDDHTGGGFYTFDKI